jgi:hypothetical protein
MTPSRSARPSSFDWRYYGSDTVTEMQDGAPVLDAEGNPVQRPRRDWPGSQHYIGWTTDLQARLDLHERGQGSRHVAVMIGSGISFKLARTWTGTTRREKRLKARGGASRMCPICNPKMKIRTTT